MSLKVGNTISTRRLTLLIDPRLAADGVTDADLAAQFALAQKMTALTSDTNDLVARVRRAQGDDKVEGQQQKAIDALAAELLTEGFRYGRPGLQAQVRYLAGLARRTEQALGRDVFERYEELRKAIDTVSAEADRVLRRP